MCDHWLRQTDANSLQYFSLRLLDGHCIGLLQGKLPPTECEWETSLLFAQHKEDVSVVHSFAKKNWQVFFVMLPVSWALTLLAVSCWNGCGVGDLAVFAFGLTAVDLVVVVAVAWRRLSLGVEEVSMSVVGGFVFALSLLQLRMLLCLHRF